MYYTMGKSYYVMHNLLRYAKNVLRYVASITLCVVITLCGVTIDLAITSVTSILADQSIESESKRTHDQCQDCSLT